MTTTEYWETRYAHGRGPGAGSVGEAGRMKAARVNELLTGATSVVDWGCGDGGFLGLLDLDGIGYLGVDVSASAIAKCVVRYGGLHQFLLARPGAQPAVAVGTDVALSLDVLYHLVDDDDYGDYLAAVFISASRRVVAHTTDYDAPASAPHVRHRAVTNDVAARYSGWVLTHQASDPTTPGFYVWTRP